MQELEEKELCTIADNIGQAYLNAEMTGETVHIKLDRVLSRLLAKVDKSGQYDYDKFLREQDDELGEGTNGKSLVEENFLTSKIYLR